MRFDEEIDFKGTSLFCKGTTGYLTLTPYLGGKEVTDAEINIETINDVPVSLFYPELVKILETRVFFAIKGELQRIHDEEIADDWVDREYQRVKERGI